MMSGSYLVLFAAGAVSYHVYFRNRENHLRIVLYLQIFATTLIAEVLFFQHRYGLNVTAAFTQAARIQGSMLGGYYISILIYRVFFHPLNAFPGPFGCRITSLFLPVIFRHSDAFRQVQRLHQQYGPFVRLRPNYLSIAHSKAVNVIYGPGSRCTKADWYDISYPMVSLQTMRDKKAHEERRRVWSAAFGDKAVRGYEERLRRYLNYLVDYFSSQATAGKPVNITKWFELYSYDFMGDLTFGKSFGMLEAQENHWAIHLLKQAMIPLGLYLPTWFFRVVTSIPGLSRAWQRLFDFCGERMMERIKTPAEIPDIASVLVAPIKGQQPSREQWELLRGDAQLVILAGSDTTATILVAAIYQLVQHPEQLQRLRDEVSPYITDPSHEVLHEKIANLPHLNAIINETLRLHPPAAVSLQRKTPPEGITIEGVYIPGNMTVMCPQYVLGRDEEVYERSKEFYPERWYLHPEMVKQRAAFAPFSLGPYGCIGKPLALLTLRNTLVRLVTMFDFEFAPGEDGTAFEGKAKDRFTMGYGDLQILFRKRSDIGS
ncbi:L-ornithine-N5-monooxygenase [Aspergillus piperis CBS 112811]|uniref:L-ornithine-N5-monooxygenase n=1 Tax=Aspergillus piperis CBS 112811 TaxID=1448313 RepID=A0A8G1QZY8_9EURO|nr:L-ornithine-N5-monooxygenase [Aspergillus piperis CBS 112811]RAH55977.1 L-ornithine-N5-monooxygenase [Aspergillus piperis CBS 112811]